MQSIDSLDYHLNDFIGIMKRGGYSKKEIKLLLCKIADSLIKEEGQNIIPIDLNPIVKQRKIKISNKIYKYNQGELIPKNYGFSVILNSKDGRIRNRTTLAHEIGHTLFFDISVLPPKRIIAYSDSEEWLCYDFGRCLLMPTEFVKKYVSKYKRTPTPQKIIDLTNLFKVSKDLFLRRITRDFHLWDDTIIFLVEVNGNELKVDNRVYKGKRYKKGFWIDGKNGLIHHEKIKSFLQILQINHKIQEINETFSLKSKSYQIEMFRYSQNPVSVLCIIRDLNDEPIDVEKETTSNHIMDSNNEIVKKVQTTFEYYN